VGRWAGGAWQTPCHTVEPACGDKGIRCSCGGVRSIVQFYNDGYRPSISEDKHPKALASAACGMLAGSCIIGPRLKRLVMTEASQLASQTRWCLLPQRQAGRSLLRPTATDPCVIAHGHYSRHALLLPRTKHGRSSGERRLRRSRRRFRAWWKRLRRFCDRRPLRKFTLSQSRHSGSCWVTAPGGDAGLVRWTDLHAREVAEADALAR